MDQPFSLYVDASKVEAGAVLVQTNENGGDCQVSFFSKMSNSHQLNYPTI